MLLQDIMIRTETPLALRLALLGMILIVTLLYSTVPDWFASIRILSFLPLQRFSWQSEKYATNAVYRVSGILSISIVYAIFIYSQFYLTGRNFWGTNSNSFVLLWVTVIWLLLIKWLFNRIYFNLHQQTELGDLVVDFQHSINLITAFIVGVVMLFDVFYLQMNHLLHVITIALFVIQFLIKLFGTILMMQKNFEYPIITLFVYLCAFEIVPTLVVAKVLFVNS